MQIDTPGSLEKPGSCDGKSHFIYSFIRSIDRSIDCFCFLSSIVIVVVVVPDAEGMEGDGDRAPDTVLYSRSESSKNVVLRSDNIVGEEVKR